MSAETLADVFASLKLDARVIDTTVGPSVTRYAVEIAGPLKQSHTAALQLALVVAYGTRSVDVLVPLEGRPGLIGIDVPNVSRTFVTFNTSDIPNDAPPLTFVVGSDINGKTVTYDLARAPHLLIAGATGSGKSVGINTLLASLLSRNAPDALRLTLIDPKRVELAPYASLPHLRGPVITEPDDALDALQDLAEIMDARGEAMAALGARNISQYNARASEPWPYVVGVIDELADLMMTAGKDVERVIARLTAVGRAAGVHLVLATQRPSTDVVTGLIKANVPSRIAYAVASATDSRVILDAGGADRLLGMGDALHSPSGSRSPVRVQGAYTPDDTLAEIVARWDDVPAEPVAGRTPTRLQFWDQWPIWVVPVALGIAAATDWSPR